MTYNKICVLLIMLLTGIGTTHAMPVDTDGDGVVDTLDNCIDVYNTDQSDTDGDGHGNICDGDFDQSCLTNFDDLSALKAVFFTSDPDIDLDGSGVVNFDDLTIFKGLIYTEPGPSATGSLCNPDSDNDGVADTDDLCSGTPPGSIVDADGCVIAPQLITVTSATASSTYGGNGPELAIDGIDKDPPPGTRWESLHGIDPSWITLNLGASYALSEVIIHWEAANAAFYEIRGSTDGSTWTTLSSESGGQGHRTDNVSVSGAYQYVQMYGLSRNLTYGYSIWEMEVYGWPAADEDGDGVDDSLDLCPGTPPGSTVDADGCVPVDTDGDGVVDGQDLCPNTPPGSAVDANGCAIIDTDYDGVVDGLDLCPNTPSGDIVDANGCTVVLDGIEVTSANTLLVGGGASDDPGFVLYVFDDDVPYSGTSTCTGGCASSWPPVLVTDGLPSGVADLGSIERTDYNPVKYQVTHKGRPLYFYAGDNFAGDTNGEGINGVWHTVAHASVDSIDPLYDAGTTLEPVTAYIRASDGAAITRFGDRGRDRHAKDIGVYGPGNSDHYDHYLAEYWHYRSARIQIEDFVSANVPQSLVRFTFITESRLGAKEFRAWYYGLTTTGQFHLNLEATEVGCGTFNDDFELEIDVPGIQCKYVVDVIEQWKDVATFNVPLQAGVNMEFEISQFLLSPPSGLRLNYYGTSYVYVIGTPGLAPFEWERGVNNQNGVNDGTPIPAVGLLGGDTTLGYNYSLEPAGRFMQMATNLSHINAQPFVRGRRVHHTNFEDGVHDERAENPEWLEQIGKAGNHYINLSCANCHVRNGRALVADVGEDLDKWVFKVAEANVGDGSAEPDPLMGNVLQPNQIGTGTGEGTVSLGAWTNLTNGLRSPNYVFSNGTPARFSARIAPQLVGTGLLDAVEESTILAWHDPDDTDADGISGRAALVQDPESGDSRLGRFGYKAATSSVRHQVAAALNTDIGVMTSVLPAPDCGSAQTNCGPTGQPLVDDQLDDLVKYISLLGVGARRDYADTAGETVFTTIGCAGCHRPTMTTSDYHPLTELRSQTIHPYTDLLLHDMGPDLADNLGEGVASGAEWRTAPLWGLGHARSVMLGDAKANDTVTQPIDPNDVNRIGYLHDGRARTIDEAIRWHGGEGEPAKAAYEGLTQTDKDALLAFLESL